MNPPGVRSTCQSGGKRREGAARALASVSLSVMGASLNDFPRTDTASQRLELSGPGFCWGAGKVAGA
jgi:hypothetical protein